MNDDLLPTDLRLALARAVLRPDERVQLYAGEENRLSDFVSLEAAVLSRRAFAGLVDEGVLALDADMENADEALRPVRAVLSAAGVTPVLVASGQSGRRHLWARIEDPIVFGRAVEVARAARLDNRSSTKMRPPGAPHRSGPPSRLLETADPAAAVAALRRRPRRQPADRYVQMMRDGEWEMSHPHSRRSGMLMSLSLSYYQAGWGFEEMFRLLSDPANRGGAKLQEEISEVGPELARRWFAPQWSNVIKFCRDHPPSNGYYEFVEVLAARRGLIHAVTWRGVAGSTDKMVLLALYEIAVKTGQIAVSRSCRQLAEDAGCTKTTASKSLGRLQEAGWIKASSYDGGTDARKYTLLEPPTKAVQDRDTNHSRWGGVRPSVLALPSIMNHDVWRRGGLPGKAREVYAHLGDEPLTIVELVENTGAGRQTVRRNLIKLLAHGMVDRVGDLYRRGTATLDEVARVLGVDGAGQRQRDRHELERETFCGPRPSGARRLIGRGAWEMRQTDEERRRNVPPNLKFEVQHESPRGGEPAAPPPEGEWGDDTEPPSGCVA